MGAVAGWSWRQRIRRRHFTHLWHLRLNDWTLECTRCHATRPDRNPQHLSVPRADELDILKENHVSYTLPQIAKAVVAFVVTVVTALGTMAADGSIEAVEVLGFLGAVVAAYGVFKKRNAPA
jgi:hypothetical protein